MEYDLVLQELKVEATTAHAEAITALHADKDPVEHRRWMAVFAAYNHALALLEDLDIPDCDDCDRIAPDDEPSRDEAYD